MKLGLLSDAHLSDRKPEARTDNVLETQWVKFEFVLRTCKERKVPALLEAGDLLDQSRSWTTLPRLAALLLAYKDYVSLYSVFGQHEMYMHNEELQNKTAKGLLGQLKILTLLNNNAVNIADEKRPVVIYGYNYYNKTLKLPIPVDLRRKTTNILITHSPISTIALPYDYIDAEEMIRELHNYYELILCGDIHMQFEISYKDSKMVNTGPMVRRTADMNIIKHRPKFAIYDTETKEVEWIDIPHKDSSEVLSREHIVKVAENDKMLEDFFTMIMSKMEDNESEEMSFKAILLKMLDAVEEPHRRRITEILTKFSMGEALK